MPDQDDPEDIGAAARAMPETPELDRYPAMACALTFSLDANPVDGTQLSTLQCEMRRVVMAANAGAQAWPELTWRQVFDSAKLRWVPPAPGDPGKGQTVMEVMLTIPVPPANVTATGGRGRKRRPPGALLRNDQAEVATTGAVATELSVVARAVHELVRALNTNDDPAEAKARVEARMGVDVGRLVLFLASPQPGFDIFVGHQTILFDNPSVRRQVTLSTPVVGTVLPRVAPGRPMRFAGRVVPVAETPGGRLVAGRRKSCIVVQPQSRWLRAVLAAAVEAELPFKAHLVDACQTLTDCQAHTELAGVAAADALALAVIEFLERGMQSASAQPVQRADQAALFPTPLLHFDPDDDPGTA
jgi:hypothetical protein